MKIKNTYLLIIVLIVLSFQSFSQSKKRYYKNKKVSSSISRNQPSPKEITSSLNHAETIFDDSISKALEIVETNLLLSISMNYKIQEAQAYEVLGKFNSKLENYKLAKSNYEKSILIVSKSKNYSKLFDLRCNSANCNERLKEYKKAIASYESALKIKSKAISPDKKLKVKLKIGNLHLKLDELESAELSYNQVLSTATKSNSIPNIVESNIGLGRVEEKRKNYSAVNNYLSTAQKLAQENELDVLANKSFDLLAKQYEIQKDTVLSIQVQEQALLFNNQRGNTSSAILNSTELSKNYLNTGRDKEALKVLDENKEQVFKEKNNEAKRNFVKTLSEVYEVQGNSAAATDVRNDYQELLDSFNFSKKQKQIILESKSEFLLNLENRMLLMEKDKELNEKTIELLKKEKVLNDERMKNQEILTYSLIIGLLLMLLIAYFVYRNSREKQSKNQLLVLKSLRNQMNPHFIFNSLNSVNSFIAKKDEKSANKYLSEFSKLMREVLECSQEDFIPLSKEIEILEMYLRLEHFRFKDEFDYTFEVDKSIQLDEFSIPPMLVQPFVENSIWHGLRYKKDKGNLSVEFKKVNESVEIVISDDGIGRKKSLLSKTENQKKMKSTGISNVEDRIDIIKSVFNKKLEISISDLNLETEEGTVVTINLFK